MPSIVLRLCSSSFSVHYKRREVEKTTILRPFFSRSHHRRLPWHYSHFSLLSPSTHTRILTSTWHMTDAIFKKYFASLPGLCTIPCTLPIQTTLTSYLKTVFPVKVVLDSTVFFCSLVYLSNHQFLFSTSIALKWVLWCPFPSFLCVFITMKNCF